MSRAGLWAKVIVGGIIISAGGPALVQYMRPTDEELVKRYNPDLQKRSAEQGDRKAQEFDDYVQKLKEWSKSDKSIWFAAQEEQDKKRAQMEAQRAQAKEESRIQREEMRKEILGDK
ncbi:Assembly factor cbp4 [Penicillium macrosclerotiorum]|uniref:Assembly factor cbp4 n=1 Tax=Penicillium macrosclerotiorum TaxID=303699 RepID=UPI002546AF73|nr:Assembly factor cbp4 [Penicillium macrosclerotiorum]KAJ5683591.1 Assembly factor cbp4 [Penicillium macrosclerotiorum]